MQNLAPYACTDQNTRGRTHPEDSPIYRNQYQRDRDRIMHSKAFRRLKHKTQVFVNPEGDHYVTRLTHTIQVTQIARALATALSLNEDLAEAVAVHVEDIRGKRHVHRVPGDGDVPLYDQRGAPFDRVFGDRIDIGSFEYKPLSADFDGNGAADLAIGVPFEDYTSPVDGTSGTNCGGRAMSSRTSVFVVSLVSSSGSATTSAAALATSRKNVSGTSIVSSGFESDPNSGLFVSMAVS